MSDPPGANVTVNDDKAGLTPVKYDFDFTKHSRYDVLVQKDGFLPYDQVVNSNTTLAADTVLQFPLTRDPSWDDTIDSEIVNQWIQIQIAPQLTGDVWQRLVTNVATR
jgi:hypothetical protein